MDKLTRRDLVKASAGAVAGLAAISAMPERLAAAVHTARRGRQEARIRFAVIGANHGHIYGQVSSVTRGGGELVSYYIKEPEIRAAFAKRYPNAKAADDGEADARLPPAAPSRVHRRRQPLGHRGDRGESRHRACGRLDEVPASELVHECAPDGLRARSSSASARRRQLSDATPG